jgi:hypothetical protein
MPTLARAAGSSEGTSDRKPSAGLSHSCTNCATMYTCHDCSCKYGMLAHCQRAAWTHETTFRRLRPGAVGATNLDAHYCSVPPAGPAAVLLADVQLLRPVQKGLQHPHLVQAGDKRCSEWSSFLLINVHPTARFSWCISKAFFLTLPSGIRDVRPSSSLPGVEHKA